MAFIQEEAPEVCIHIECENEKLRGWKYCKAHDEGVVLGRGDTYDQYQIIEADFIEFIKIVPIDDENHLKVHSPFLRDIIIRSCVQIEIFFKEWSKYECSEAPDISLYSKYHEIDKRSGQPKRERNWNFGDYFYFKEHILSYPEVYVRPMSMSIKPFLTWESVKEQPFWWKAYNAIKHNGLSSKKDANLKNALYSLAALFKLHYVNQYSRDFLDGYRNTTISSFIKEVRIKFHPISSPIDTKRYLFRENSIRGDKEIKL
ncbi:MAG: hypothetical protein ACI81T_001922 [Bacteroidia bacterium]|jgi:hypothetical protein